MTLQILLLKRDSDQEPKTSDLHPPSSDLLGRFLVTGTFEAVLLALVPDKLSFAERTGCRWMAPSTSSRTPCPSMSRPSWWRKG